VDGSTAATSVDIGSVEESELYNQLISSPEPAHQPLFFMRHFFPQKTFKQKVVKNGEY